MRKSIVMVLLMNTVFSSVLAFSNIFVNIFLWKQGKSLIQIGMYNTSVFVFLFIGTVVGAYIMKWTNNRINFFLSSFCMSGVFGFLILNEQQVISYILVLGAMYGLSLGLYYSGFNLFSILLTNAENRQLFVGMEQITSRLTSLIIPLLFSYIIMQYSYLETFRFLFSMLVIQVVISFFTPKFSSNFSVSSLRYRDIWKEYRFVLISLISFGFFQSMIQLAGSVLLFSYIPNETTIGWLNTFFALLGILTLMVISRPPFARKRMKMAYIGAVVATLMTIFLFLPKVSTILLFNVLAAIALPFIWIPVSVTHFGKIKELACESEFECDIGLTAHYLIIREFMLNMGRAFFYSLLIVGLDFQQTAHYIPVLFVSLMIPLSIYFCNRGLFQEQKER